MASSSSLSFFGSIGSYQGSLGSLGSNSSLSENGTEDYSYFSFLNNDEETFDEMDRGNMMAYVVVIVVVNSLDMFNATELEKGRS
jgi:hypothetical protein